MKKLILSILFILCLSFQASAWNPFVVVSGGGSTCPSWYASAVFSWDGDHSSGTNYGCAADGTPVTGTNSNLTITTAYGESGSNGAHITDVDQYLEFTGYIDDATPQTLWIRIYISAAPAASVCLFDSYVDGNNFIRGYVQANLIATGGYNGQSAGEQTATSQTTLTAASWIDIAYSWGTAAGAGTPTGDHSYYWGGGWQDDDNELGYAMTSTPTEFAIGEHLIGGDPPGGDDYINITQFALVDGYKASKPW